MSAGCNALAKALLVLLVLAATGGSASAHGIFNLPPGLLAGLSHPVSVPAHVLAVVACALLAGQHGMERMRYRAVACAAGIALGLLASFLEPAENIVQLALLALAGLAGFLVLLRLRLPEPPLLTMTAAMAFGIGIDSGLATDSWQTTGLTLAGTAIAVVLLYIYLSAVTAVIHEDQPEWMRTGVRIAGSWIVAVSALIIALSMIR